VSSRRTSPNLSAQAGSRANGRAGYRVALLYNLKANAPKIADEPEDAWADLDSEKTIHALERALRAGGHVVYPMEGDIRLASRLRRTTVDIAFNICEGHVGDSREAQVPALLEMLGIPYTGSKVLTQAISLDKAMTKRVLLSHGLPTAPFQVFKSADEPINADLRYPLFVKPNREGTGMGVTPRSIVHNEAELRQQVAWVLNSYRQEALVERFLQGRELTVGLIGNIDGTLNFAPPGGWTTGLGWDSEGVHVFPPMEIDLSPVPADQLGLYTSHVKADIPTWPNYVCPADVSPEMTRELQRLTLETFRALGCLDVSRVDFRLDEEDGKPYILEINTLPGLSPGYSDLVMIAQADGMEYTLLVNTILNIAAQRYSLQPTVHAGRRLQPAAEKQWAVGSRQWAVR
jgi:D-alanine-D-alanine ligase